MANEIYDSTWWGNTIDTASSIGTSTEMIQGQFNLTKLGDELVTNGSFDSDTVWIKNGQVTIGGGVAYFDSDGTFTQIAQSISGVSGKNIKVVIEITEYTQGTLKVLFSGGTQQNLPNSIGVHTLYFNNADSDTINISRLGGVTNLKIDNVSVKEVRATTVEASKCLADAIHRIGIQDIQN